MRVGIAAPDHQVMCSAIFATTTHSAWEAKNFEKETEKFDATAAHTG